MTKKEVSAMYNKNPKKLYSYIRNFYMISQLQEFNLGGIRYEKADSKDAFDDILFYFDMDGHIFITSGTTEAGLYYTNNPLNKEGAARLGNGFHKGIWGRGYHKGKYAALVQREGAQCVISRDTNKNQKKDKEENYRFVSIGLNFHRASLSKKLFKIGKYSAGCIVANSKKDYDRIMVKAYDSSNVKFNFMLLDGDKI